MSIASENVNSIVVESALGISALEIVGAPHPPPPPGLVISRVL